MVLALRMTHHQSRWWTYHQTRWTCQRRCELWQVIVGTIMSNNLEGHNWEIMQDIPTWAHNLKLAKECENYGDQLHCRQPLPILQAQTRANMDSIAREEILNENIELHLVFGQYMMIRMQFFAWDCITTMMYRALHAPILTRKALTHKIWSLRVTFPCLYWAYNLVCVHLKILY